MDVKPFLGEPQSLEKWVQECINNPRQQYWLVFDDTDEKAGISLTTKMFPITGDTRDMSEEEFEEFDRSINKCGFSYFLNLDQLEDILSNLQMQKSDYSKKELLTAIRYYFSHDAFINMWR